MGSGKEAALEEDLVISEGAMASVATNALMATTASNVTGSTGHGSHCWEEDGSFHVVCMFVIAISCVCFFITVLSVYKIIILIYSSCKDASSLEMTSMTTNPN